MNYTLQKEPASYLETINILAASLNKDNQELLSANFLENIRKEQKHAKRLRALERDILFINELIKKADYHDDESFVTVFSTAQSSNMKNQLFQLFIDIFDFSSKVTDESLTENLAKFLAKPASVQQAFIFHQYKEVFTEHLGKIDVNDDFITALGKNDFSDDFNFKFMSVYMHPEKYITVFLDAIIKTNRIIKPLREKYADDLQEAQDELIAKIEKKGSVKNFLRSFNATISGVEQYDISVALFTPYDIFVTNQAGKQNQIKLLVGIATIIIDKTTNDYEALRKQTLETLKAFSDPTKFSIIEILQNERLYSLQIAKRLSLTGATISYHLNLLVALDVLSFEIVENKTYYTVNADVIAQRLDYAKFLLQL